MAVHAVAAAFMLTAPALGQHRRAAQPDAASWSALWTLEDGIFNAHPFSCSV